MAEKFDYQTAIADANELVEFFGMNAVLRRGADDRPCRIAMYDYLPRDKAASLANPTDRRVLMSAANSEVQAMPPDNELDQLVTFVQPLSNPPVEDEILPFTCPVKPLRPAGVTVFYEFTVRR